MKNLFKIVSIFSLLIIVSISCNKEKSSSTRLSIGESATVTVYSELKWNNSEIKIESGETYTITAEGTWTDLTTTTTAAGYTDTILDAFSSIKRDTAANWFELIVSADRENLYSVGSNKTITFNEGGQLSFFANDAEDFYENNSGQITTTITRK